jgi:hypothetical protein
VTAVALALFLEPACERRPAGPSLADHYELERTIHVAPIEPFARAPASLLVLPDGRFLLPETEGVWIHVTGADGEGITRVGGPSAAALDLPAAPIGRFRSLSALALLPDGRVLAGDRTAGVVTVFGPDLTPRGRFTLPETRSVWDLEALPGGRVAAAVAPRHPTAGGQVVLFTLRGDSAESLRLRLPPDPVFRANRWSPVASTRIESLGDGRLLAWWTTLPWVRSIDAQGDSLPRLGRFSARYRSPSSGPREGAPLERLSRWYASFTPLVAVESAEPTVAFQFLEVARGRAGRAAGRDRAAPPGGRRGADADAAAREEDGPAGDEPAAGPRSSFLNLYRATGQPIAADLPLPAGARLLASNDLERLYLATSVRPRQLDVEVWRPRARR